MQMNEKKKRKEYKERIQEKKNNCKDKIRENCFTCFFGT